TLAVFDIAKGQYRILVKSNIWLSNGVTTFRILESTAMWGARKFMAAAMELSMKLPVHVWDGLKTTPPGLASAVLISRNNLVRVGRGIHFRKECMYRPSRHLIIQQFPL